MLDKNGDELTSRRIKFKSISSFRFYCYDRTMIKVFLAPLLLCSIGYAMEQKIPFATLSKNDLKTYFTFDPSSDDPESFKTLTIGVDNETLFVGARHKVFGLRLDDISKHAFTAITWDIKREVCKLRPQSDQGNKCYNQIQVVQQLNETHVVICGSNSMVPQNRHLTRENAQSDFILGDDDPFAESLCSPDPDDSITSLAVTNGRNSNIFSTGRSGIEDPIKFVKVMNSDIVFSTDTMVGKNPKYVASFLGIDNTMSHTMSKIYVASYEIGMESNPSTKAVPKPTITQLCVNDVGGKNVLPYKWTSLLKLRLSCATADTYPLEFNLMTDMVRGGDDLIYGTFMTMHETSRSNAVCSFRLADIQNAFNGNEFWETTGTKYSKVTSDSFKPYRPGMCAYAGMDPDDPSKATSKDFPGKFLNFMSTSYLVASEVSPAFPSSNASDTPVTRGTLFVRTGDKFRKIAVQQITNSTGAVHDIIFVGKDNGQIHKFFSLQKNGKIETIDLASYEPTTEPIISMVLSQEKGQLYVGTENALHQISTTNCAAYTKSCEFCDSCHMCVLSRDPGCGWDEAKQECVAVQDGHKSNLKQDIYYGNAASQCRGISQPSSPKSMQGSDGETVTLGHLVTNPTVKATWYKCLNPNCSSKRKISNLDQEYNIKFDGQLQVLNFDPSTDSGVYECDYMVKLSTISISWYELTQSSGQGPLVTGLVVALVVTLLLVVVLIFMFKRRSSKFTPGDKRYTVAVTASSQSKENASSNNNSGLLRNQSEYDDRANRPLLPANLSPIQGDAEAGIIPSSSQRNARSLDNILDNREDLQFADDDSNASSERMVTRKSSLRETSGRQRVPPTRTKSMPGSALYVVYGGKKLMCSTLQRSKQGTWTIEVKPNQSGMSDMAAEHDEEIIDIVNEDGGKGDIKFMPSPDHKRSTSSKIDSANNMKDARKAFFGGESSGLDFDRSPSIHYVSSPPNPAIAQKPKVAPKPPPHVIERAASMRKQPLPNQPSRASLRSSGQNSSEDRDSDSTIKGSVLTLKPDDHHNKNSPYNSNDSAKKSVAKVGSNDPSVGTDLKKKNMDIKPTTPSGQKRCDRSSGSSDGDEQLHGRDSGLKKTVTPIDSPSKQSRTSHGSSSSGDYKSARSSVVSEPTNEHR